MKKSAGKNLRIKEKEGEEEEEEDEDEDGLNPVENSSFTDEYE